MRLRQDHTAARQARRYARQWSSEQHLPEIAIADIELVVDELVNNAVIHAVPPYDFEIYRVKGSIRGEVCDHSTVAPAPNSQPDHHGGFGLNIVAARTSRWGSAPIPDGKKIWFEIDQP
jgi:two-component sensor histidine kinase